MTAPSIANRRVPWLRTRAPWLVLGACLLVGPTPGAVGSCGGDDDALGERADVPAYCRAREELVCVRARMRGETTTYEQDDCRRAAIDRCAQRFWPGSCAPSVRSTEACLTALRLVDTLDTPVREIDECNAAALRCAYTQEAGGGSPLGGAVDAGVAL